MAPAALGPLDQPQAQPRSALGLGLVPASALVAYLAPGVLLLLGLDQDLVQDLAQGVAAVGGRVAQGPGWGVGYLAQPWGLAQ